MLTAQEYPSLKILYVWTQHGLTGEVRAYLKRYDDTIDATDCLCGSPSKIRLPVPENAVQAYEVHEGALSQPAYTEDGIR